MPAFVNFNVIEYAKFLVKHELFFTLTEQALQQHLYDGLGHVSMRFNLIEGQVKLIMTQDRTSQRRSARDGFLRIAMMFA